MSYLSRFIKRRKAWLNSRFSKRCLILVYHRIGTVQKELDPYCLTVTPENFSRHLEIMKTRFNVISLSELARRIGENDFPGKSVVLTFDDGYRDNLLLVKPLLEKNRMPAVFFLTSKYFGTYFWWDILVNSIVSGRNHKIVLQGKEFFLSPGKNGLRTSLESIYLFFKFLNYTSKIDFVNEVNRLPFSPSFFNPSKCMSAEEIKAFSAGAYVEIGGHTARHFPLGTMEQEIQKNEIIENKNELENLTQKEIKHFAYPNGDYNDSAVNILKKLFKTGVTGNPGAVQKNSNLFLLSRLTVKNYGSLAFNLFLKYWS